MREEIETTKSYIDAMHKNIISQHDNISEMADEITTTKNAVLSEKISPDDTKRSEEYMNRKEAQAALFSQAIIHTKAKKWDAALILWQDYLRYDSENAEALFYAALSAASLADQTQETDRRNNLRKQAERWYRDYIKIKPNTASALCNLGILLSSRAQDAKGEDRQKLWKDAEKKYQAALNLDPDYPYALFNMACLRAMQRDMNGCLEWLERWFDADPKPTAKKLNAVEKDPDFDAVRGRPEFQAFLVRHGDNPSSAEG